MIVVVPWVENEMWRVGLVWLGMVVKNVQMERPFCFSALCGIHTIIMIVVWFLL